MNKVNGHLLSNRFSGGPTRSFLMNLWNQISTVCLWQGSTVKIFQDFGEYVVPHIDSKTQEKGRCLYEAIGRIMAYCILHGQLIANNVLVRYLFWQATRRSNLCNLTLFHSLSLIYTRITCSGM
jgi:hypothetical protein